MFAISPINNLLDIDCLVQDFFKNHEQGINTLHRIYFKNNNQISLRALIAELEEEIKNGCVAYVNKGSDLSEINNYLFYIANAFCKKKAIPFKKKKTEYLCPGCLFLGKDNIIQISQNIFKCEECSFELKKEIDPKKILLYKTFANHLKNGYRCFDCKRFIPHPLDVVDIISCPYFDCCFAGKIDDLKKMNHPTSQSNPEKLLLDVNNRSSSIKDKIASDDADPLTKLEIKEDLDFKIKILKEVIETQTNSVPYSSSEFTIKHKLLCYKAFDLLLDKFPEEMVGYLLNNSRSGGFQHKIFQEYIKMLEKSLPFYIKRHGKPFKVESLLDPNMCVFDGISVFDGVINSKLEIKNNTQEFYVGGRKASYTKPFYIGKLLNIVDKKSKNILLDNVIEYSFSKIKMKNVLPETSVIVSHLRIPPHYQMGGMVYVNRVRKKIIDKTNFLLKKDNND